MRLFDGGIRWMGLLGLYGMFFQVVGVSCSSPTDVYNNSEVMAVTNYNTSRNETNGTINDWKEFSSNSSRSRLKSASGIAIIEPQKKKKRKKKTKNITSFLDFVGDKDHGISREYNNNTNITAGNSTTSQPDNNILFTNTSNTTISIKSEKPVAVAATSTLQWQKANTTANISSSIDQQIPQMLPKHRVGIRKRKKIKKKPSSKENQPTTSTVTAYNVTTTTSTDTDTHKGTNNSIQVSCVTWNLAEESPPPSENILSKFNHSDFLLISVQECETIQPRRTEGRRSRFIRQYCIQNLCGPMQFVPIAIHSLGGIQLLLFCKRHWLSNLRHVRCCDVACGIGNTFHNKGAIGAFVTVGSPLTKQRLHKSTSTRRRSTTKDTTLLFISAHLEAHVHNIQGRNNNFWRIITEFSSQAPFLVKSEKKTNNYNDNIKIAGTKGDGENEHDCAILRQTDYIFFCGDLNYRLDLPREIVEHHILQQQRKQTADWLPLLRHDQLFSTISQGKAFPYFQEGKITFAPTFKLDPFSFQTYDTSSKQRIPAWTDRILFSSNPPHTVKVLEYDSLPHATHSDHRPVYGTFLLQKRNNIALSKPL